MMKLLFKLTHIAVLFQMHLNLRLNLYLDHIPAWSREDEDFYSNIPPPPPINNNNISAGGSNNNGGIGNTRATDSPSPPPLPRQVILISKENLRINPILIMKDI